MIVHLSVKNYVLIESLEIDFCSGLTTITGETGAGKSVMLGAVGLILGERADKNALLDKDRKCIIEGTFNIKGYNMKSLFNSYDLDHDDQTFIRREILPSGKSRAFINDTPVKLKFLKDIGDRLINIHSQHETLILNRPDFQMTVIDDYAGNQNLLARYKVVFSEYIKSKSSLEELKVHNKRAKADADYYQFLFEELDNANLKPNEKEELEKELKQLTHAEDIREALYYASENLSESESNAVDILKGTIDKLNHITDFYPDIKPLHERIESSRIELEDIATELDKLKEEVYYEPDRLEYVNERLNMIYGLEQKHNADGTDELIDIKAELGQKLEKINSLDTEIENQQLQVNEKYSNAKHLADELHQKRVNVIPKAEQAIEDVLDKLNMKEASVKADLTINDSLSEKGIDKINIKFSANKGLKPDSINKIASGGELSRLMLAIKSILTHKNILPTIIFDEIDSGVSGNTAVKVGEILSQMSRKMQVIAITHLPQIAAKGKEHLKVFKYEKNGRSQTDIQQLNQQERTEEIALMISGKPNHKEALKTAHQLING
ncbi:MAG: DNA repair protein RecN [Bacteroidales bacterium]|nr:DNA repair protein RecN [Bacteroidales bacterium]